MNKNLEYLLTNKMSLNLYSIMDSDEEFIQKLYQHAIYSNRISMVKKLIQDFPINNNSKMLDNVFHYIFESYSRAGVNLVKLFEPYISEKLFEIKDFFTLKSFFNNLTKKDTTSSQNVFAYAYNVLMNNFPKDQLDACLVYYAPLSWVHNIKDLNCIVRYEIIKDDGEKILLKENLFQAAAINKIPKDRQQLLFHTHTNQIEPTEWQLYITQAIENTNFTMLDFLLNFPACQKELKNYFYDKKTYQYETHKNKKYLDLFPFLTHSYYSGFLTDHYADMFIHLEKKYGIVQTQALDEYLKRTIETINLPGKWQEIEKLNEAKLINPEKHEELILKFFSFFKEHENYAQIMTKSMDIFNRHQENALNYLAMVIELKPDSPAFNAIINNIETEKIDQFQNSNYLTEDMNKVFQKILLSRSLEERQPQQVTKKKMKI